MRWRLLHLPLLLFALAATAGGGWILGHGTVVRKEETTAWDAVLAALPLLVIGVGLLAFLLADARRAGRGDRVRRSGPPRP